MSETLAKIFGLYFLAIGLSFFLNPNLFKSFSRFVKDEGLLTLGAIIALLIGATVVSLHNVWSFNWQVIITILGWWSLIKGFALLAYPRFIDLFDFIFRQPESSFRMIGIIWLAIGLFLSYHGWNQIIQ